MAQSSNLVSRLFSAMRAGFMFGGKRDLYSVYGYPTTVEPEALLAKYERQDITTRIVDNPAEETWTNPPKLVADSSFVTAWEEIVAKYKLWALLSQVDRLCCFDRFVAVLVGMPGELGTAAPTGLKIDRVPYLQAFGAGGATITNSDLDTSSPRFGKPAIYALKIAEPERTFRVHYSRIIHIVDRPLQGDTTGQPRLVPIYNLLDDMLKIAGGSAETYWLTANRGMQVDVDKEMSLTEPDAKALADELEEFQHQLRRYIRTRGVTITPLGSEVADPKSVFEVLLALISATTGIPQRILVGAEAGQLASEQDRANWSEYIQRRRKAFAEPFILLPMIARFTEIGLLPKQTKPVEFKWPEAFHQNPLERSQTMAQTARAAVNLSRQTQYGFPTMTLEEVRVTLGLPEAATGTLPPAYVPTAAPVTEPDADEDPPAGGNGRQQARPHSAS